MRQMKQTSAGDKNPVSAAVEIHAADSDFTNRPSQRRKGRIIRGVGGLYGVRLTHTDIFWTDGQPEAASLASPEEKTGANGKIQSEDSRQRCETELPRGELLCRARGIFRLEGKTPLVGDEVLVSRDSDAAIPENPEDPDDVRVDYVIDEILPRRSVLLRPPVANLTHLFTVLPAAEPKPDLLTTDKMTVIAENTGIEPVIVINKADLDPEHAALLAQTYRSAGYAVFPLSAATGVGTEALFSYIWQTAADSSHPMLAAFAGVSGAGKSTLMSRLFPDLSLKTGRVSRKTERGRHTTRHVELYPVLWKDGGEPLYLADTPGFSMLDFTRFNFFPKEELALSFREFADAVGTCRYTRCTHTKEEGCAVLERMRQGLVAESRHESYVRILEEMSKKPEWARQKEAEKAQNPPSAKTKRQGKR